MNVKHKSVTRIDSFITYSTGSTKFRENVFPPYENAARASEILYKLGHGVIAVAWRVLNSEKRASGIPTYTDNE